MRTLLSILLIALPASGMGKAPATSDRDKDVFLRAGGMAISKEGYNLIIKHEVGGGAAYYNRYLASPAYVSENSGITIGIGYDLRFNTRAQIAADWSMLHPDVLTRLQAVSGKKGTRSMARSLASIRIPYDIALDVYNKRTIPRFAALTVRAYPGVETLHPHIQSANLSWVFNRGQGISPTSARDREKRLIRRDTPSHPERLGGHYRASKWVWVGKGVDGLLRRREDEALLAELPFKK